MTDEIQEILNEFNKFIEQTRSKLKISGKTLLAVSSEQPELLFECLSKRAELKQILKTLELQVNRVRSNLFRQYTENMDIALSDRAKEKYIDSEQQYIDISHQYNSIFEVYEQIDALCQAFIARGYTIKNIIELKLNALEYIEI